MNPVDILALTPFAYASQPFCESLQLAAYAAYPFRRVNNAYYAGNDRDWFLDRGWLLS